MRLAAFPLLLCLGLTALVPAHAAQDAQAPDQQPKDETAATAAADRASSPAESIKAALEQLGAEIKPLRAEIAGAKGGQKALLLNQLEENQRAVQAKLDELATLVAKREQAGEDASDQRAVAESMTREAADYLRKATTDVVAGLKELAGQTAADSAEQVRLDKERATLAERLEFYLGALLANANRATALGMDAAGDLAYLDDLLRQRAETLAGSIDLIAEQRDAVKKTVASAATEDERKAGQKDLAALDSRLKLTADRLRATVSLMDERGLESTQYKQKLIRSTGQITESIFEADVALGLLRGWLDQGRDWLVTAAPSWVFKILVVLLILWIFRRLSRMARRLVDRALVSSKAPVSQLLQQSFQSVAGGAVMLLGVLIALSQLGINLAPLLAGFGIAGFIVGFALQDTLGNFASGVMILFYRPFDVGDAVEAGGVMGTVKQMNLVSTTILTWDNQKLVVPNKKIWGEVIRNITAEATRRVDLQFGIGYGDDVDKAERVLHDIVTAHPLVLGNPEPVIRLHALGESSIDFVVRPWAKTGDYWTVYWDITREVKKRFDAEGISIPFPQRDVHIYQESPSAA